MPPGFPPSLESKEPLCHGAVWVCGCGAQRGAGQQSFGWARSQLGRGLREGVLARGSTGVKGRVWAGWLWRCELARGTVVVVGG